jgi:cobalt-zinc-cadmium resistance protein CzcA
MMENSVHRLETEGDKESPLESVRRAAHEVARPMVFAVTIIIAVYLPILFLQGLEGRMFRPMAITVCAALAGSLLLALTLVPLLTSVAFSRRFTRQTARHAPMMKALHRFYERTLTWTMNHRAFTLGSSIIALGCAFGSLFLIGTEFMPKLDEGSILVETRKLPGVSLTDSVEISKRIEQRLRQFPEIADVVIKIGRPDFATEAMGINEGDTYLLLRPIDTWTRFHTKDELIAALDKELASIPGIAYNFTQPMAMRI